MAKQITHSQVGVETPTEQFRSVLALDIAHIFEGTGDLPGGINGKRIVQVKIADEDTALTVGDGKFIFCVPRELNGYNLIAVSTFVTTVSTSGIPTYQVRNITQAADMLTTRITIDVNELTSYTAAIPPVIDPLNDDVATGDLLAIDKDVAGTGEKGDGVILTFELP